MSHIHPDPLGALVEAGTPASAGQVWIATAADTLALQSGATLRSSLGLAIGTDVQAFNQQLADIAGLGVPGDGIFLVGDGANYVQESGNTARTSLGLGTGDSPTFAGATLTGDLLVQGRLVAQGVTELKTESVLVEDNYLDLNTGYTTAVAQTGGLTVRYLPTATSSAVAATAFTATTVEVASAAGFAVNDIIAVDNPNDVNNSGLYVIDSIATNVLTIKAAPGEDWAKTGFTADATVAGTVSKVNVSVLRVNTSGDWESGKGSTAPLTYSTFASGLLSSNNTWTGTQDFQAAITTDAVNRNIRTINSNVSALASDHVVVQDSGATITYTLPAATGSGRELVIKKVTATAAGDLVVDGNASETIDGATTATLKRIYESITVVDYDTGVWAIV